MHSGEIGAIPLELVVMFQSVADNRESRRKVRDIADFKKKSYLYGDTEEVRAPRRASPSRALNHPIKISSKLRLRRKLSARSSRIIESSVARSIARVNRRFVEPPRREPLNEPRNAIV